MQFLIHITYIVFVSSKANEPYASLFLEMENALSPLMLRQEKRMYQKDLLQ